MLTDGRTDMTKLIAAFRNFSNEPKHTETKPQIYYLTIFSVFVCRSCQLVNHQVTKCLG